MADYLAPKAVARQQLDWLGDYFYLGKPEYEESIMLRVAIVNYDDSLTGLDGVQANDQYQLSYNAKQGYLAEKRGVRK